MSITIKIPTALKQFAEEQSELTVSADNVGAALSELINAHQALQPHLYRNGNELRNFLNIYLNDEDIRHLQGLDSPLKPGDLITIVPSIAGGRP